MPADQKTKPKLGEDRVGVKRDAKGTAADLFLTPQKEASAKTTHPRESATEFRRNYQMRKRTKEDLEVRARFNEVGADHSGAIDRVGLTAALKSMGKWESETQVDELLAAMDTDGNGTIELRELLNYLNDTLTNNQSKEEEAVGALFQSLAVRPACFRRVHEARGRKDVTATAHPDPVACALRSLHIFRQTRKALAKTPRPWPPPAG